ncbi:MAG: helix-turn-helix domain-containing protein [Bacilli bacterium]|nr:helix-turn-helix domain-containing protein [Bacilli bacterium]
MAKKESIIKKLRKNAGLTQEQFCTYLGIPKTTLCNWEQGLREPNEWTLDLIIDKLSDYERETTFKYNETKGVYLFSELKHKITAFCIEKNLDEVYLFGEYAEGKATASSQISLLIKCNLTGMKFYGLASQLKTLLHKKVEVVDKSKLILNSKKDREIRKNSIPLYIK